MASLETRKTQFVKKSQKDVHLDSLNSFYEPKLQKMRGIIRWNFRKSQSAEKAQKVKNGLVYFWTSNPSLKLE